MEKQLTSSIWNCSESQKPQPKWIFLWNAKILTAYTIKATTALGIANCQFAWKSTPLLLKKKPCLFSICIWAISLQSIKLKLVFWPQSRNIQLLNVFAIWWHAILGKFLLRALPTNSVRSGWSHYLKPTSTVIPESWLFILKISFRH